MKSRNTVIIISLIFAGLLIGTGFMQIHLKEKPQLVMLIFGGITLIAFLINQRSIATILFYILIATMLYINYFILTNWIIDIVNPNRGWVEVNGEKHRVMDMAWIWAVLAGLIFSPITLLIYHKAKRRNRIVEIAVTIIFIIVTSILYIKHELL